MSGRKLKPVIGLEIHAQLLTKSKLFCGCSCDSGAAPNTSTCPVCLGLPGALPVLNRTAHKMAVWTAAALQAKINPVSYFDRKNYFYPDLPKGYQITQQRIPLAINGKLQLISRQSISVGIQRLHLEEDAGKSAHMQNGNGRNLSLIDFNRSGVPLIEIVTRPELRSSDEAVSFLKQIRALLIYLGVCDGNMQAGSLRCDANLSLYHAHSGQAGIKSEIKNLNSFRFLKKALDFEIKRQNRILKQGQKPAEETRYWDEKQRRTRMMRKKEKHADYRFFPEPDIPPLKTPPELIRQITARLPERPFDRWQRYIRTYRLLEEIAYTLVFDKKLGDYFDAVKKETEAAEAAAHWITGEVLYHSRKNRSGQDPFPVPPPHLAELIRLVEDGRISIRTAKNRILPAMISTGDNAAAVTEKLGLEQMSESGQLKAVIHEIIQAYPKQVQQYRSGKTRILDFFIGKAMAATEGRAEPKKTKCLFKQALERYNDKPP